VLDALPTRGNFLFKALFVAFCPLFVVNLMVKNYQLSSANKDNKLCKLIKT